MRRSTGINAGIGLTQYVYGAATAIFGIAAAAAGKKHTGTEASRYAERVLMRG